MKTLIASALLLVLPALASAQTASQPAGKTAQAPKAKAAAPAKPSASRQQLKTKANQTAAGIVAAEAALTPAELAIAERVHVGQLPCELGVSVTLESDAKSPGYFNLHGKGFRYRMHPVATSTGAIRLEDPQAGAVWLQLANKSMLMDQKQGRRLADECMSPAQLTVAEALKKNPAPSLIDTPAGARP